MKYLPFQSSPATAKTIDGEEVVDLEIYYTNRYFKMLQDWDFDQNGERCIRYDCGGKDMYEIQQGGGMSGRNDTHPAWTKFTRNDRYHRSNGAACIVHFDDIDPDEHGYNTANVVKQMSKLPGYWVDGKEWSANEYNFFIQGIVKA